MNSDALYSVEQVTIMYPIVVDGDDFDYTGDESETYDESAEFSDELYCKRCLADLKLSDLIDAPETDE